MRSACFRPALVALALALLLGCRASDPPPVSTILLITADGVRPEEVGTLGGATPTPALDQLVAEGAAFEDVWTVTPLTRPAVATYLTGTTPPSHGVRGDISTRLAQGTPTLASVLRTAGYATAAFPDSSALGFDSGLLDGFELVDDPPVAPIGPLTWLPTHARDRPTHRHVEAWLGGVEQTAPAFGWVHLSDALIGQLDAEASTAPSGLVEFDRKLGTLFDALRTAGRYDAAWIVVAVSGADVVSEAVGVPGPGLSLAPAAIRVPLFVKPPRGQSIDSTDGVWAPDVAATLAAVAAVSLPGAIGADLRDGAPSADRVRLAWSGAPRDQFGWRPIRAAGQGAAMLIDGLGGEPLRRAAGPESSRPSDDDPVWARLAEALATAGMPAAPSVEYDGIRELLERYGVELDPVSPAGRPFDDPPARQLVGRESLAARVALNGRDVETAVPALERVLAADPDNLAARVELAQLPALSGDSDRALNRIRRAVSRYPDHPDVLHWLAHSIWGRSVPDATTLLIAVEPFKPQEGDVLYDLACAHSLAGELSESEAFLRRAIAAGFRYWQSMDNDPDLRNLRQSGRFATVMREYRR